MLILHLISTYVSILDYACNGWFMIGMRYTQAVNYLAVLGFFTIYSLLSGSYDLYCRQSDNQACVGTVQVSI